MNRLLILFIPLLICLVPACVPTPEEYVELETREINVSGSRSILVQVDYGEVSILQSSDDRVTVEGQVLFDEALEYLIDATEDQILIKAYARHRGFSKVPLKMIVRLPPQMQVKVETDNASVSVQDFQGNLEVASISGNILVEHATGELTLRSNRGNITVREGSGNLSVVGNYGALTIQNVSGETAVSTIMGNVVFGGLIQMDDIVRLETDHGSVSVNLSRDSALNVQVRSTSGDVACMLPGLTSSTRTCDGTIRSGGGNLSVRTVSGAVTVQLLP
jgi:hypothetical protein